MKPLKTSTFSFLFTFSTFNSIFAAPEADRVLAVPDLNFPVNFNIYSGYLSAKENHHLHYFFTSSKNGDPDDPLIVWFNGGPGCSSLLGLFTENGPFRIKPDKNVPGPTLTLFEKSWNNFAHMLFIESPIGVGFSYSENSHWRDQINDETTAEDAHLALKDFFLVKFPELQHTKFVITGESYSGIYVPTLGAKVDADTDLTDNFQGVMIGNGFFNEADNSNSLPFFAYYHGILGQNQWDSLVQHCCKNSISDAAHCDFSGSWNLICKKDFYQVEMDVWNSGISPYNLYGPCLHNSEARALFSLELESFQRLAALTSTAGDPPCTDDSSLYDYLNRDDVKNAFHVRSDITWDMCSDIGYKKQVTDTTTYFEKILSKPHRKVTLYNGDVDMACNFLGTERFVNRLGKYLNFSESGSYRHWLLNGQVGGFAKDWSGERGKGLHFRTIRGAGHMVPTDKPDEAYYLIREHLGMLGELNEIEEDDGRL